MTNYRKSLFTIRLILSALVLLLIAHVGNTQSIERQLIGSAGINNDALGFTSSMGEVAILTLSGNALTISQGFQQAETTEEEPPPPPLGLDETSQTLLAYPNPAPVNGQIILEIGETLEKALELDILTLGGKKVGHFQDLFNAEKKEELDISTLPEGQYTLLLYSANRLQLLKTHKILIVD